MKKTWHVSYRIPLYSSQTVPDAHYSDFDWGGHKLWTFVDSGATFSILSVDDAHRIGIEWDKGHRQMIVVGDGSYIPTYFHDLSLQIGSYEVIAPIGFSERLGVGFNILGRTGIFDQFQVCFNDHFRKVTFEKICI